MGVGVQLIPVVRIARKSEMLRFRITSQFPGLQLLILVDRTNSTIAIFMV